MLPRELAQARLIRSGPREHDGLIGRDACVDHRLQPLVRHEAGHTEEEVGGQRVEDGLIRGVEHGLLLHERADVDGRVDHIGVAAPLVGDARRDEVAVRGNGDGFAGALAIERLEDRGCCARGKARAAVVELWHPDVAGWGVRIDELRGVPGRPGEAGVVGEDVAAAQDPVGLARGEVAPHERHERQRGDLAAAKGRACEDRLVDVGEASVAVIPHAHTGGVGERGGQDVEDVLRSAVALQPLVDQDPAHRTARRTCGRGSHAAARAWARYRDDDVRTIDDPQWLPQVARQRSGTRRSAVT